MKERPSFYAVIPATVRYDNNLGSSEKLFYAEITAMSEKQGYCWASNSYFSNLYNVSKNTISRWVANLKDNGHVVVNIQRDGKQIVKREIYPIQKIEDTYPQKSKEGTHKNGDTPTHKNGEDNTTRVNTTRDNTSSVIAIADDVPSTSDSLTWQSAVRISNRLLESICDTDPTHKYNNNPPSLKHWVKEIDLALRRDNRTEEQMNFLIDAIFYEAHKYKNLWEGWCVNIESGAKLRKQFDKIKNQIKTSNGKSISSKIAETEQFLNSYQE